MQEVFEKIIEKLEEIGVKKTCNKEKCDTKELCRICVVDDAIEIVKQEAEQYEECYKDCGECEAYNKEKHHCPKFCKVIKETVKEIEENHNDWISCSERLPDECVPVNVTWINRNPESYYAKIKDVPFSATAVYYNSKWYWYSSTCVDYLSEYGKNDFDLVDKDIDIVAWQPLPKPFQPKGE